MPLYFYIIILSILVLVFSGLMFYFRFRMKYIYSRFNRFSRILSASISGINNRRVSVRDAKPDYDDIEDIRQLIDSFSLEFKKKSALLDSILENIVQGVLVIDKNRKILSINGSLSDLFYMDPRKVIGLKTAIVFNNVKLEDLIGKVLEEGVPLKEDLVFYGDEDLYLSIEAIPLGSGEKDTVPDRQNNNGPDILLIMDNTTQEVEFSKLRSQFAANVSHEMRTPLTSIKGYMETILESGLEDRKMLKDYLGKSLVEVEKLNFLIKDVLDLSRIEYRRNVLFQEDNDLVAIIKDIIGSLDFLAKRNEVKISLSSSDENIFYHTDEELFRQLVRNILENSIFYSGKGSKIEISISNKKDHILLEFTDNGMGIKKKTCHISSRGSTGENLTQR